MSFDMVVDIAEIFGVLLGFGFALSAGAAAMLGHEVSAIHRLAWAILLILMVHL